MTEIKFTSEIKVRLVNSTGGDHTVVAAAKVSTSGEEALGFACPEKTSDNAGLINYLMKMRHGSVFEHSLLTFFVHAPVFIWREWHRHRVGFAYSEYGLDEGLGQSFNEESGRYKVLDPVFYIPPRDRPMFKVEGWKPGRPKFLPILNQAGESAYNKLCRNLEEVYRLAYTKYKENLGLGIDPGLARDCLPVGIYSSCWVTTNPRALMHFLSLRTHDPQSKFVSYPLYEIELAARACEKCFSEGWPLTYKAFVDNGRVAP